MTEANVELKKMYRSEKKAVGTEILSLSLINRDGGCEGDIARI